MPVAYCLAREALRAEPERLSANGEAAPEGGKCGKRKVSINCGLPLCGALLDEGVKNNMPVAYCLAREALRAEPERRSANGEAAPEGGKCNKKGRTLDGCS